MIHNQIPTALNVCNPRHYANSFTGLSLVLNVVNFCLKLDSQMISKSFFSFILLQFILISSDTYVCTNIQSHVAVCGDFIVVST